MNPLMLLHQWGQELLTMFLLYPFYFFFLFFISFILVFRVTRGSKLNLPPSPPKLPILGNLHQLGKLPHQTLSKLSKKYGPLMLLHFGKVPTLIVSSTEFAEEIIKKHDIVFSNRPRLKAADVFFNGCKDLAFCPYGEYWRQARKIVVLELLSQRRVQEFQYVREKEVNDMIKKICKLSLDGFAINLSKIVATTANNIVSRAAFGQKSEGDDVKDTFGEMSRKVTELLGAFCVEDLFPSFGWVDVLTGLDASLKETSKVLHAYLDHAIEEHKTLMTSGGHGQIDKRDLIDILLDIQKNGMLETNLTQESLKAILMDMFVGGTDTTAATIVWAMTELVKNPTKIEKAQNEVRRIVGKKSKIEENDIAKMKYIKWVVKETLRLHCPATLLRETSSKVILGGYDIPSKTRVLINIWAIQREPSIWQRAEDFVPERYADNSIDLKGLHLQFTPFGMGRRICPGLSFAIAEVEYALANLLYWFDWYLPDGLDLDMSESFGVIIHKKIPLCLIPVSYSP